MIALLKYLFSSFKVYEVTRITISGSVECYENKFPINYKYEVENEN